MSPSLNSNWLRLGVALENRYFLNEPSGKYFYAHVDDKTDSFCEGIEKKREKQRKELDAFLMRAVDSIDFSYEFEEDPSLKYNFHSKMYIICLLSTFLGLFFWYLSYLRIDDIIRKAVEVGKLNDTRKMRPIIMLVIYFDCFVMMLVLITGLAAKYTIKTNIYKVHSISLVWSILSIIPLSYLSEIYLIVFTSRMLWYIYCRFIISIIYNSLVYPIFQSIDDSEQRSNAILRYKTT